MQHGKISCILRSILMALMSVLLGVCGGCGWRPTLIPTKDLEYEKSDGKITITRLKNECTSGKVIIPNLIEGLPVTAIKAQPAMFGYTEITSVTIPKSVTKIGYYTFEDCERLTIRAPRGSEYSMLSTILYYHHSRNSSPIGCRGIR